MKRLKLFIPVILFITMAVFLYFGLGKDPTELESVTVGQKIPNFELKTLESNLTESVSADDLVGEPFLLNIWATWCPSCLIEHPFFLKLSQQNVKIVGVNYKDDSGAAIRWLEKYKNPYVVSVYDDTGRLGFDLGVTGAPETYLIDAEGFIVYRREGIVDEAIWQAHFSSYFEETRTQIMTADGEG